jgi:hypothetical protein
MVDDDDDVHFLFCLQCWERTTDRNKSLPTHCILVRSMWCVRARRYRIKSTTDRLSQFGSAHSIVHPLLALHHQGHRPSLRNTVQFWSDEIAESKVIYYVWKFWRDGRGVWKIVLEQVAGDCSALSGTEHERRRSLGQHFGSRRRSSTTTSRAQEVQKRQRSDRSFSIVVCSGQRGFVTWNLHAHGCIDFDKIEERK